MAVYDKAYELAKDLKGSEEYREYQKAKADVVGNEQALSMLRQYRKAELSFQAAFLSGTEPDEESRRELEKMSNLVNMHGPIKRYMEAERRMLVTLADIQRILTDAMNLLGV